VGGFYTRTVAGGTVTVRDSAAYHYVTSLLFAAMIAGVLHGDLTGTEQALWKVPTLCLGLMLALRMIGGAAVRRELRRAMNSGDITMTGTRFSVANPPTYTFAERQA